MQEDRQRQKQAIEAWMLTIVKDGGIERSDDLHIDTIDDKWKSRHLWIEGALAAYRMALELRDLHRLPVTVEVAFSLQAGTRRIGVDFHTPEELLAQLDWSPP